MGQASRKQVNKILRKVAKKAERAKAQSGWPVKLSPKILAACVGGGITSQQIQHVYSLIRAAVSLYGHDDAPSYADPPFACPPDEEAAG